MWASLFVAWAAEPPSVATWTRQLLADPAASAARLRDPEGPLAAAFPTVRGSVAGAPVWVLEVALDEDTARYDGVLAWTAPADVGHLVLRLPVEVLEGRIERFEVAGHPFRRDGDLVRVSVSVREGETVALRIRGRTTAPAHPKIEGVERLLSTDGALVLAGWLPLPTHCDDEGRWDEIPWTGQSDPGGHDAMVFLAAVHTRVPAPTLLHPGVALAALPGATLLAAVGVRELPLVALEGWETVTVDGAPPIGVWSRPGTDWADDVAATLRSAVDDFTVRYGPLSSRRVDAVLALPGNGSGAELPGMILLGSARPAARTGCLLVSHEIAHQWWYGEVGSDALREPWVDEGLATWSAVDHCRRSGQPMDDWSRWRQAGLVAPRADRPANEYGRDEFLAVYTGPASLYEALAGDGLDPVMARWLDAHRWGFVRGEDLVQLLVEARGRAAVDAAWSTHMIRP